MIPKIKEELRECNVIDIRSRQRKSFNDLIPEVEIPPEDYDIIKTLERNRSERKGKESLPEETFNEVLETCFKQGGYIGFRNALIFTLQANWGVRCSDARIVKKIDFINENGAFRESCLFSELKTGKPRTMYINESIIMCVLMVIWSKDFKPLDYLLRGSNYKKVIDPRTGNVMRKDGHIVYELDWLGHKIPEPLSYPQIRKILSDKLVDDLGIQLKHHKNCEEGKFDYATHSLRKLYSNKVEQLFQEMFGEQGKAHTAAMEFLNWDLNHSSLSTTSRYCGDFESVKKEINMNMNLGYDVIKKYYEIEKEKYLRKRNHKMNIG